MASHAIVWSSVGGSGTTTVAVALASLAASERETILVDCDGQIAALLGVEDRASTMLLDDWFDSSYPPTTLHGSIVDLSATLRLIPSGTVIRKRDSARWNELGSWLQSLRTCTIVDFGRQRPMTDWLPHRSILVLRNDYVGVRQAQALLRAQTNEQSVLVVTHDEKRSLTMADVENALGRRACRVRLDPSIARAADAGRLATHTPRSLTRSLRAVAEELTASESSASW